MKRTHDDDDDDENSYYFIETDTPDNDMLISYPVIQTASKIFGHKNKSTSSVLQHFIAAFDGCFAELSLCFYSKK